MKKFPIYILIFVLGSWLALADAEEFAEAKKLIDTKTPCSSLSENQLEILGDYLMEQMHPGEAHEIMDEMMGGEGSESMRLMHIAIANRVYCNDINSAIDYGFGSMMGVGKTNYGGMRSMMGYNLGYGMMGSGYGMMGNYGYWGF